jgi:5-methylcytosine-specific restriction endonuclease McrBC GTP-binding regulatory subunit McrB
LIFPPRILKAFHTSLKIGRINPLTVLAGVSGTGKSILPIRYAEAMGIHSLNIAVQPRWDSPQDLFGFYNYLEHKYKATELARALVRMDKYNFDPRNFPALRGQKRLERMLLVLLDEMNLARIEYYFSEFLSKLEIRRQVDNPDKPEWRASAEFELETGPRGTGNNSSRLWVGENILFVGTMNEDETTQTPSDKVLDRANVLRFARPPEGGYAAGDNGGGRISRIRKYLPFSEWQRWVKRPATTGNQWDSTVNPWIDQINVALDRIGRPFGYRVQQAIREYILNYPGVEERDAYKIAFADQVEQKVLPKLRGIDLRESAEALDDVQDILVDLRDEDLLNAFQRSREDESSGMFIWRGVTRSI